MTLRQVTRADVYLFVEQRQDEGSDRRDDPKEQIEAGQTDKRRAGYFEE